MNEPENVQARTTGIDWESFGDIGINTAATIFGERHTIISGVVEVRIEGRDAIYQRKVQRVTSWTAIELHQY